jgi:phage tail-like protein
MKRSEIENLLPLVFRRTVQPGTPIFGLLEAIEALHTPSEEMLESLHDFFNPYRTPDRFVPMLARWVDLDRFLSETPAEFGSATFPVFPSGLGRLRDLITNASFLSMWRGTAQGLLRFLEIATGIQGFEIIEQPPDAEGRPKPFHILVRAPGPAQQYRQIIQQIVEMEKPAYVTYQLEFPSEGQDVPPPSGKAGSELAPQEEAGA